jgi:hypothetical protein
MLTLGRRRQIKEFLHNRDHDSKDVYTQLKRKYSDIRSNCIGMPAEKRRKESLELECETTKGINSANAYYQYKQDLHELDAKIRESEEHKDQQFLFEGASALLNGADEMHDVNMVQKRDALAVQLFHTSSSIPVFVDTDRCTRCNTPFELLHEESILTCSNCGMTNNYIQLDTDHQDVNCMGQDTAENHIRSTCTNNVDTASHRANSGYPTSNFYAREIRPFCVDVPKPPPEVYERILQELGNIHIGDTSKVPDSINSILKSAGLKAWIPMHLLISMTLKAKRVEDVPVFSVELYERLVRRYDLFIHALRESYVHSKSKVLNNKFLTRVFLYMEGKPEMARCFDNQRTTTELKKKQRVLLKVCEYFQNHPDPEFDWPFVRSI